MASASEGRWGEPASRAATPGGRPPASRRPPPPRRPPPWTPPPRWQSPSLPPPPALRRVKGPAARAA
eukprot:1737946-Prymnesium_polylepis.1